MAFAHRMTSVPVSKVEIAVSCSKLRSEDVTSLSDPCVILFTEAGDTWYEFGRTETIKNNLNPEFTKLFEMDYFFEEVQNLKFAVYDIDSSKSKLSDHDFLGDVKCTLGQVVSRCPYTHQLMLKKSKNAGTMTIRATEVAKVNDVLHLSFKALKLDKKDFLGKSDPYLEFSRATPDGAWQTVHRTEVIKDNLNPVWKTFAIKAQKLCAGNYETEIKVAVYDWDDSDDHDLIGQFTTSIAEFMKAIDKQIEWPCINPKKQAKKKSYQNSGIVHLMSCKITKDYSFLDYVFGGLQINFMVGIDFTASNGDPRNPGSLHYVNPYQPNEYMKAIQSVGAVIQDYDSDQMFPALGFGARIPPQMAVSHEFAINFNATNPFCAGVGGILQAYQACIAQVQLYGPTNFSPIIYHTAQFAAAAQKEEGARSYFVLLIITDGVISDLDNTLTAIVYASGLPLSLIIVGVGNADFTEMNVLDGDQGVLRSPRGDPARRDIVQFVSFRDFATASPGELAKHVLAEVPRQVCDYFRMVGIVPGNPRPAPAGAPQ